MAPVSLEWFQVLKGEVWNAQSNDAQNHNQCRQSQCHREIAAMAWSEQIDGSDHEDDPDCRNHDVILRDAEVAEGRPSAEGGCNGEVRYQQEGCHDREDFSMRAGC